MVCVCMCTRMYTPHCTLCTWGVFCVCVCMRVHVCVYRGMKVNTSVCVLQTHPGVSTCVHESMCAHWGGGGALTALLVSLLQRPCEAQGGCLLPESCVSQARWDSQLGWLGLQGSKSTA